MGIHEECEDFFTDGYCDTCIFSDECRARYEEKEDRRRTTIVPSQTTLEERI